MTYPLNSFPTEVLDRFRRGMARHIATQTELVPDCSGPDFERLFAASVLTPHRGSRDFVDLSKFPIGWTLKTIKVERIPNSIHLIWLRLGPEVDRNLDPQVLGGALLDIWNSKVNAAQQEFPDLRTVVLLRNPMLTKFALFEFRPPLFSAMDFRWEWNGKGNLHGSKDGKRIFAWTPHGSQFYITEHVASHNPRRMTLPALPRLSEDDVLREIGYTDDRWTPVPLTSQQRVDTETEDYVLKGKVWVPTRSRAVLEEEEEVYHTKGQ